MFSIENNDECVNEHQFEEQQQNDDHHRISNNELFTQDTIIVNNQISHSQDLVNSTDHINNDNINITDNNNNNNINITDNNNFNKNSSTTEETFIDIKFDDILHNQQILQSEEQKQQQPHTEISQQTSLTSEQIHNQLSQLPQPRQQTKQIQFNELKHSQFTKQSTYSESGESVVAAHTGDNVSLVGSSNISVVSSINLDTHLQDDDQVESFKNKRNKSELEFTMGYGQHEFEIELDPDTLALIDRPVRLVERSGMKVSLETVQSNTHHDHDSVHSSIDNNYDSLDLSLDDDAQATGNTRNNNRNRQRNNDNSNNDGESFGSKLKRYDCAAPYIRLLRQNAAYRYLFLSSLISLMGDWFNELACLTLLARFGASGMMVSLFLVLRECPPFFFSPITGVVSDRFDRRYVMIVADILRMALIPLFLLVRSADTLWLLYVLAFLQFTIGSFFLPAKSSMLPMLVKKEDLITANATEQSSYSSMMLIGASLGGAVSYGLGTDANYLIDACTYLGSAICVLQLIRMKVGAPESKNTQKQPLVNNNNNEDGIEEELEEVEGLEMDQNNNNIVLTSAAIIDTSTNRQFNRLPQDQQEPIVQQQSFFRKSIIGIREYFRLYIQGLRFLYDNTYILIIALTKSCGAIVWAGIDTVLIRFAETNFKMGEDGSLSLGIILACGGLGILLVPFVFARIVKDKPENHLNILRFGFFMNCFGTLWLGFTSNTFPLFLIFNVLRSSSTCVLWLYSSSILQQLVPDHVRGRVFSFEFGLLTVVAVIAKLTTGILLDTAKYSPTKITYIFGGVGAFIFVIWNLIIIKHKSYENHTSTNANTNSRNRRN